MDGLFACPECGSPVEIGGLAPGRQVRCRFCQRLLEVPYLPRVSGAGWKRRRFGQWKYVRWAWWGVAVVAVAAATLTGMRIARRQYRSHQEDAIRQILASSRDLEGKGRLDQALVELDTAIELIRREGETTPFALEEENRRRGELARREAQAALDRLARGRPVPFPMGDWLNLLARSQKDPDVATLRPRIEAAFRRCAAREAARELDDARAALTVGRVAATLSACDRIAALLPHLAEGPRADVRRAAEELVGRLVEAQGVALEIRRRDLVHGSYESYRTRLLPMVIEALSARGYLPDRETSPWRSVWQRARYRLRLEVSERLEGHYLSTENRRTRIESRLRLSEGNREVWFAQPIALTSEHLPGLPAYLATRLAVNPARSEEVERLLYDNARGQIEGKIGQALDRMRVCCP